MAMTKLTTLTKTVKIIRWLPLLLVVSGGALAGCENRPNEPTEQERTTIPTDIDKSEGNKDRVTDSETLEEMSTTSDKSKDKVKVDAQLADAVESLAKDHPTKDSDAASINKPRVVSPKGYGGLHFGQTVTSKLLAELGLKKEEFDEACYFVTDSKLTYTDPDLGEMNALAYQIINDKVALISIYDPKVLFYTGIKVGDPVEKVMSRHKDDLTYQLNAYNDIESGSQYELIYNINFDVINPPKDYEELTAVNLKMRPNAGKLPLQIKYSFAGGAPMQEYRITADEWDQANKAKLTGKIYNIDIGTTEAIYLIEGCA
jgi:hypothetical protein